MFETDNDYFMCLSQIEKFIFFVFRILGDSLIKAVVEAQMLKAQ